MKLSPVFFRVYSMGLLISFIVTSVLITSVADYTMKNGFVLHEKYIIPSISSVSLITVMLYFYKKFEQKMNKH